MSPAPANDDAEGSSASFPPTRWSLIAAAQEADPAALEQICRTYWYPLYVYVRRSGQGAEDAQDLTQAFFARLLDKGYLQAFDREKGRLRTFLVVALKRFLANEWDRRSRQRRGGDRPHLPFDTALAERHYAAEPAAAAAADLAYDRRWALTLLEKTMSRLRNEYDASGRGLDFDRLKPHLATESSAIPYRDAAAALGMSEAAARTAVHRLRKRFRQVFREEIARTVSTEPEIDAEVRHLVQVLSAG